MQVSVETAIRNAEASLRMEGMQPTPKVIHECKRVLEGELSYEEYIANIREQYMEVDSGKVQP
jgi:hypothetical protein